MFINNKNIIYQFFRFGKAIFINFIFENLIKFKKF